MFSYFTLYKMKKENQKQNIPIQNQKAVSVQFGDFQLISPVIPLSYLYGFEICVYAGQQSNYLIKGALLFFFIQVHKWEGNQIICVTEVFGIYIELLINSFLKIYYNLTTEHCLIC